MGNFVPLSEKQENRYERALSILGSLLSFRSAWIGEEREKAKPDPILIEKWRTQQQYYSKKSGELDPRNDIEIEQVLDTYGTQLAEELAKYKAQHEEK